MSVSDQFWNATLEDMKRGYVDTNNRYICLLCGKVIEKGIVYPDEDILYDAGRFIARHIEKEHKSVFEYLIQLDKKYTGLSDHQNNLLRLFYEGKSDGDIQKILGIGSASTIRNHRFVLKEKERQAKVFLAMMELLKISDKTPPAFENIHRTAKMVDDRYNVTQEENQKILERYFPQGIEGPLKTFNMKEKSKIIILREIQKRFNQDRKYSEKEVNEILKSVYDDFVTLRRYLIEYGFLNRKPNGSEYWVKIEQDREDEKKMDRKNELKQIYKETKTQAGVYQIKNLKTNRILVDSTSNLKTINGKKFQLQVGSHKNKLLQKDWNEFGEEAFDISILEILDVKEDEFFDAKDALEKLEEKWLTKLQPYGEKGYNTKRQS